MDSFPSPNVVQGFYSAFHLLARHGPCREVKASSVDILHRQQTVDRFIRRIEHWATV
ncbi:MAG: hypothetical protein ACRERE_43360 [Candidatus Entotheonellia bacterium]